MIVLLAEDLDSKSLDVDIVQYETQKVYHSPKDYYIFSKRWRPYVTDLCFNSMLILYFIFRRAHTYVMIIIKVFK